MTSSIAAVVNLPPPTNAPASDATSASSNDPNKDFSKPLQRAHQQLARQTDTSRPAHDRHASAKSTSSAQTQSPSKGKQDDKDDDQAASTAPAATAAMLALLGQSVPASAAASAVPAAAEGEDATDAVTATAASAVTPATVALLGAAQAAGQAKAGSADDFDKTLSGIKDKSLSMATQDVDDGDDAVAASTTDAAPSAKGDAFSTALQALTASSSQGNHSDDSLDALKNLTAQAMSQQPQTASNVATAPAPHALTMQSSVGSPSFGQELSQQVTWLGGQDVKEARIRLHPEDLGELDVKVSVKQDHVDVAFIAQHPQAVHAVQQTLSQLDSMLAHHGLSLGQAQVGQGNTGQGSSQTGTSGGSSSGAESGMAEGVGELASVAGSVMKVVGLVDMFA
jgi:flagellar hook-length control protein FliK